MSQISSVSVPGVSLLDSAAAWFEKVELWQAVVIGFSGACLRTAFELWIYKAPPTSFINSFIHFPVSFVCFALSIAWFVCFITRFPALRGAKIILVLLPVVAFVPLIDMVLLGVNARGISYLYPESNPFLQFGRAVFTRHYAEQISVGQLVIVHGTALATAMFCWGVTRRAATAFLGWVGVLGIIFFWATLPMTARETTRHVHGLAWELLVGQGELGGSLSETGSILGGTDAVSAAFYVLGLPVILLGMLTVNGDGRALRAILGNLRGSRLVHYLVMAMIGLILAVNSVGGPKLILGHPMNFLAIGVLFTAVAASFISAVWVNDVYDLEIDKHVHADRPIASGVVSIHQAKQMAAAWGVIALLASCLLQPSVALVIVLAYAASLLYSSPPLRLRRFFPWSLMVLSCISVLIVQAGYVFAGVGMVTGLPLNVVLGLLVGFALLLTFKDLPDSEGDARDGVATLATLFPIRTARLITGVTVAFGGLVVVQTLLPGYLGLGLGIAGGVVGMCGVCLSDMKRQIVIFAIYFLFVGLVGVLMCVR